MRMLDATSRALSQTLPADLFQIPRVIEASTVGYDPDRQGIGSSPVTGDAGNSVLFIPQTATGPHNRYLFRLCGFAVPPGGKARLIGLRQIATIAQMFAVDTETDSWSYKLERAIETAHWAFPDANISWHLRVLRGPVMTPSPFPAGSNPQPNWSMNLYGTNSALILARPPSLDPGNGGVPPGEGIGSLGTFTDIRFPWVNNAHSDAFGHEIVGPAIVSLWASVRQTNTTTRPYLPQGQVPTDVSGLTPEDRFLLSFGDPPNNFVRYRHIGGGLVANVGPIDMPWAHIDRDCAGQTPVSIVPPREIA